MDWSYDKEADLLSIKLADTPATETVRVRNGVLVCFDAIGRPVRLDVLGASSQFPAPMLERLGSPVELLTLGEAAAESGLAAATLRKQIHNKRIRAQKRGHDWLVSRADLWNYLESREARGRPAVKAKANRERSRKKVRLGR